MGTVHATYPIHFQWDEMTMKSTYMVLIVVAISLTLLICYFILRLCIKSQNIDSGNEQNNKGDLSFVGRWAPKLTKGPYNS